MRKEEIQFDYLKNHPEWKVCQHRDMYHFNTDTVLLGEFIKISPMDSVLDVGTNNGVLLLYCAMKKAAKMTGIELNEKALEMAKETIKINNIQAELIASDFKTYFSKTKYNVIVSNPPYFNSKDEKIKNKNEHLLMARHEDYLSLSDLAKGIANNIVDKGRVYIIHRPNRLQEIRKVFKQNDLFIHTLQYVYDIRKKEPISLLIEAFKGVTIENVKVLKPLTISTP